MILTAGAAYEDEMLSSAAYREKDKNYIELISYCDLRWGTGNLYENLGFKFSHKTKPNYFYTDGQRLFNRFSFRKNRLVRLGHDKEKSEKQIMRELGYKIIHDVGTNKYVIRE